MPKIVRIRGMDRISSRNRFIIYGAYVITLIVAGLFFLNVQKPIHRPDVSLESPQENVIFHVMFALGIIIGTARLLGYLFTFLNQPAVMGEIIGGIVLGPSILGKISVGLFHFVLPITISPLLGNIAQIGIVIYMFLVGLDLDLKVIRKSGHITLAISHASIVLPFIFGALLALGTYSTLANNDVPFLSFVLFFGVSLSITAFPVLARILTDLGITKTPMGIITLTCAAIDDVTAWCLLALAIGAARATMSGALATFSLTILYVALMIIVIRPIIARVVSKVDVSNNLSQGTFATVILGILISSSITELIGIHAVFGAFLLGAVVPDQSHTAAQLKTRLEYFISVFFLPIFFAFTGMRTEISLINSFRDWCLCFLIIVIATSGKFGGTFISARLTGFTNRNAVALGMLMNTRGLVELIVLNIGLDLKIISPKLFTMLVLMALFTTFTATPIFQWVTKNHPWKVDSENRKRLAS